MSHVIGTVALFLSMLLIATSFNAIGVFLMEEAVETDMNEISQSIGDQVTQLVALANLTSTGFLVKELRLPPTLGRFGFTVSIAGGAPPGTTTTITSPTPPTAFSPIQDNAWVGWQFAFVSDNSYAAGRDGADTTYTNFGINVPAGTTINYVRVSAEHRDDSALLNIQMSRDGGASFIGPIYQFPQLLTEGIATIDVTTATPWTSAFVNAIAAKVSSRVGGAGTGQERVLLDLLTIQVSYTWTTTGSSVAYVLVLRSDDRALGDANFTLPWSPSSYVDHDPSASIPGVTNRSTLLSGLRKPVIWAYSNRTHVIFGLGTKA